MNTKITTNYPDDNNLYIIVRRKSDAYIRVGSADTYEALGTWNDARAVACAVSLTGLGGGIYEVDLVDVVSAELTFIIFLRAGTTPAITDPQLDAGDNSIDLINTKVDSLTSAVTINHDSTVIVQGVSEVGVQDLVDRSSSGVYTPSSGEVATQEAVERESVVTVQDVVIRGSSAVVIG